MRCQTLPQRQSVGAIEHHDARVVALLFGKLGGHTDEAATAVLADAHELVTLVCGQQEGDAEAGPIERGKLNAFAVALRAVEPWSVVVGESMHMWTRANLLLLGNMRPIDTHGQRAKEQPRTRLDVFAAAARKRAALPGSP